MAEIMAVLEGFEIYADKDKKLLLYSQDYRKKVSRSKKRPTGNKLEIGGEEIVIEEPDPSVVQPVKAPEFNPAAPAGAITPAPGETAPFNPPPVE